MTTHELAQQLLKGADQPVTVVLTPAQPVEGRSTDYFEEPITDLYRQAVAFGQHQTAVNLADTWPEGQAFQEAYWAAWYAGRRAAVAVLREAEALGLSADQIERLRATAAAVAYD